MKIEKDLLIENFYHKDVLSVRAINVCINAKLFTVADILDFYQKHQSFKKLRNCGNNADLELIDFCQKYELLNNEEAIKIYAYSDSPNHTKNTIIKEKFSQLSELKKSILYKFFLLKTFTLTIRTKNKIDDILDVNNIEEVIDKIFSDDFYFKDIKNIGDKLNLELEGIKTNLISYIEILESIPDEKAIKEYIRIFLKTAFHPFANLSDEELAKIFDDNHRIKLFGLLNFIISSGGIFTNVQQEIFKLLYTKNPTNELSIDSIAAKLNLTKERVRQIKISLEKDVRSYFSFISDKYILSHSIEYNIDYNEILKIIEEYSVIQINKQENVNFNATFNAIIFEIISNETYRILDIRQNLCKKKSYKNIYLIKEHFFRSFNYERFLDDLCLKLNTRIDNDYSLNFHNYFSMFVNNSIEESILNESELKLICEVILLEEFGLVVTNNTLMLLRNTKKLLSEYYYEILEKNNGVMTIEEIVGQVEKMFPFLNVTIDSVRAILGKAKEDFIYFGRNSTYGLRKWESEKGDIKAGTIRSITEEFLQKNNLPIHLALISEYVQQFRKNTYPRSILDNLKADDADRFVFFSGNYIGLKALTYDIENIEFKKLSGVRFTNKVLSKYNNWLVNDFINHYSTFYNYEPFQIQFVLDNKKRDGRLKIIDGRMIIF